MDMELKYPGYLFDAKFIALRKYILLLPWLRSMQAQIHSIQCSESVCNNTNIVISITVLLRWRGGTDGATVTYY